MKLSKKEIIERSIRFIKDTKIFPYLQNFISPQCELFKVSKEDIEDPEPSLYNDALVVLFAALWQITNHLLSISNSLGLPIVKYEFLQKWFAPLTYSQFFNALNLIDEDDVRKVLTTDGVKHFNIMFSYLNKRDKVAFVNYCEDNKIGNCCIEIYRYLFHVNSKTIDYLIGPNKRINIPSILIDIKSAIKNSCIKSYEFFPDIHLYINHRNIDPGSYLFWICLFRETCRYIINDPSNYNSPSRFEANNLWEEYKSYFKDFDFENYPEALDSKAAHLLGKAFYDYFISEIETVNKNIDEGDSNPNEPVTKLMHEIEYNSRRLPYPYRIEFSSKIDSRHRTAILISLYGEFGFFLTDLNDKPLSQNDFVYMFGGSIPKPPTYNPPYVWNGEILRFPALIRLLYEDQPSGLDYLVILPQDKDNKKSSIKWSTKTQGLGIRMLGPLDKKIQDLVKEISGESLRPTNLKRKNNPRNDSKISDMKNEDLSEKG